MKSQVDLLGAHPFERTHPKCPTICDTDQFSLEKQNVVMMIHLYKLVIRNSDVN